MATCTSGRRIPEIDAFTHAPCRRELIPFEYVNKRGDKVVGYRCPHCDAIRAR